MLYSRNLHFHVDIKKMAASMRLSRAVTLLLRRADNIRRLPVSSSSALLSPCPAFNANHNLHRFVSTTQFFRNEASPKGIAVLYYQKILMLPVLLLFISHSGKKRVSSGNANASGHCGQVLVLWERGWFPDIKNPLASHPLMIWCGRFLFENWYQMHLMH